MSMEKGSEEFKLERKPKPDIKMCDVCMGYGKATSILYDTSVSQTSPFFDCQTCHGWGWVMVKRYNANE